MPQLGRVERVEPRAESETNLVRSANFSVPRLRNFTKAYAKKATEKHAEYKRCVAWIMKLLDLLIEEVSIELTESRTLLEAF